MNTELNNCKFCGRHPFMAHRPDCKEVESRPTQEFNNAGQHRLVRADGKKKTRWASYTGWTYLDGWVGHTAYFGMREGVISSDDFCKMSGTL